MFYSTIQGALDTTQPDDINLSHPYRSRGTRSIILRYLELLQNVYSNLSGSLPGEKHTTKDGSHSMGTVDSISCHTSHDSIEHPQGAYRLRSPVSFFILAS